MDIKIYIDNIGTMARRKKDRVWTRSEYGRNKYCYCSMSLKVNELASEIHKKSIGNIFYKRAKKFLRK